MSTLQTQLPATNQERRKAAEAMAEPEATTGEKRWFTNALSNGKTKRWTETVNITPGLAALMLQQNIGNRNINRRQVELHIERLRRGDFVLHHHGISFANTCVLNDGQHRLTAIYESRVAGAIQVTFGAERSEFAVIDQGRARTAGNMLSIAGQKNPDLKASVAKRLLELQDRSEKSADPQRVYEFALSLHGEPFETACTVGQNLRNLASPTAIAVAYYWIAKHSKAAYKLGDFFNGMRNGENLTGAKLRLREWLLSKDQKYMAGASISSIRAAAIIRAWNSWLFNKKTFSTQWNSRVSLPDVE